MLTRLVALLALSSLGLFAADTLDIYWIDVEGGAATLIVTPEGETVLMDAGWSGRGDRDPKRIEHVLKHEAKAEKLNYFITSHFHGDHVGGLPALAKMVPIGAFLDHGVSVDAESERGKPLWDRYLAAAGDKRRAVKPGETLPLKGVELTILAADNAVIAQPVANGGGANSLCDNFEVRPEDKGENGKSVGFLIRVGDFEFLDLGDLTWNYELEIACPVNLIGEVDLYQTTHHGMDMSGAVQHIHALNPTVAVMNNGHRKGGTPIFYDVLKSSPGIEDIWQSHRALSSDAAHNTSEELTANLVATDSCEGHWIKASIHPDGSYTITNSRNGFSKTYQPK